MKLAFVDVETTGFDAGRHRVVEAALQLHLATPEGLKSLGVAMTLRQHFDRAVTPWTPEALKVNGYSEHHPDWYMALMPGSAQACTAWTQFAGYLEGAVLCSQNVPFDRGFIEAELRHFGIKPKWERRFFDIQALSALVAVKLGLPKAGLHDAYAALGGPKLEEHRAMADVERGKFVYEAVTKGWFST